jgi:hypothetical protein
MSPQSTENLKRLAIFVEGKTELQFVERIVTEVAGRHNVRIETRSISGGTNVPRSYITLKAAPTEGQEKYFVLIVDCQGDQQVKTRIVEEHQNLSKQGYTKIIGIRDVFPDFKRQDIPKLRLGLMKYISGKLIPVEFVLSVMEIEAWFLAEASHFLRIDPSLDVSTIKEKTFLDLLEDMTARENPASDLKRIYDAVGIEYKKGSETTVEKLDYTYIYTEMRDKIESVEQLMSSLDDFLAQPADHK